MTIGGTIPQSREVYVEEWADMVNLESDITDAIKKEIDSVNWVDIGVEPASWYVEFWVIVGFILFASLFINVLGEIRRKEWSGDE